MNIVLHIDGQYPQKYGGIDFAGNLADNNIVFND